MGGLISVEGGGGVAVGVVSGLFLAGELAAELGTHPFYDVSAYRFALTNGRLMAGWAF